MKLICLYNICNQDPLESNDQKQSMEAYFDDHKGTQKSLIKLFIFAFKLKIKYNTLNKTSTRNFWGAKVALLFFATNLPLISNFLLTLAVHT